MTDVRARGGHDLLRGSDRRDEEGRVAMLVLVLSMICMLLVSGVIAVTSVHLSRMKLLDTADGAALAAANASTTRHTREAWVRRSR